MKTTKPKAKDKGFASKMDRADVWSGQNWFMQGSGKLVAVQSKEHLEQLKKKSLEALKFGRPQTQAKH